MKTPAKTVVVRIRHFDDQQILTVRLGLGFQAICALNKTPLEFNCRKADCGVCVFRVLDGAENLSPKSPEEIDFLQAMRADSDERLACQTRVMGNVGIHIEF